MRRVVKQLNLAKSNQTERLSAKLAQAGYRSQDAMIVYLFGKVVGPIATGLLAAFLIYALKIVETTPMFELVLVGHRRGRRHLRSGRLRQEPGGQAHGHDAQVAARRFGSHGDLCRGGA